MKLKDVDFTIDPCLLEPNFIEWLLNQPLLTDEELERAGSWAQAFKATPSRDAETSC